MKKYIQNAGVVLILVLFLPYTMTLLINGREGIHREQELSELEYQVLYQLMQDEHSWMQDQTLELLSILYRTELVRTEKSVEMGNMPTGINEDGYLRMYQAVSATAGQVIQVNGEYRELPYHVLSAGKTRDGQLLGEGLSHVAAVDCPVDLKAENYLQICVLSEQELELVLGKEFDFSQMELIRDSSEYVIKVQCPKKEWQGEEFRTLLHLPSSSFWMEETERGIRVTVKGSGHGFGISLYTADQMVQGGGGLQDILDKFYKNAECITIP